MIARDWIAVVLVGLPIYAAIGALVWRSLESSAGPARAGDPPLNELAGIFWPAVLPAYLLVIWPIKGVLHFWKRFS